MDFSYHPDEPSGGHRRAFRTTFPGLTVRINNDTADCPVHDISSGGVAFSGTGQELVRGNDCVLTLCIAGRAYLADLPGVVMRMRAPECVCNFMRLNRRQEIQLDKLILETQKRIIARIRAAREQEKPQDEDEDSGLSASQLRLDDLHIEEF